MDSSALESSGKRPDHPSAWTWRRLLGFGIVATGVMVLLGDLYFWLAAQNPRVQDALLAGSLAAFATALGTVPVALSQTFSQRVSDSVMGFGAGVMLAASAFSLVIPGIAAAKAQGAGAWGAGGIVGGGILVGALLLLLLDRLVPHEHFVKGLEGPSARAMKRVWLFVLAITLHNLPEGMAIGVAFGGTDTLGAQALATGISIQDMPEGLVVAMALRGVGYRKLTAVGLGILSGLIEPIAAVFGAAAIGLSAGLLPWGLAMAAGAMLFVISHEIIPESHRQGHETCATVGLMLGFVVMMLLDTALS
ncbi:ZIP family zinc transporter [Pigmentiphaga litoralis]|uniref:ZIP family zinc transporter n=2 Tax=Pigmentiphaga litoralis TaxID=516702 RepID=A0A7Y9LQ98_9BURK|nr:ZIP family zinc transporter [Pigmentiphaga litoralis]NYE85351.1 ZIP family zinc transporter [Pigmentiphaga litoralis]